MKKQRAYILGLATNHPPFAIEQDAAASLAASFCTDQTTQKILPKLYKKAGVAQRFSVLLEERSEGVVDQQFFQATKSAEDRGPRIAERMRLYEEKAILLGLPACRAALTHAGVEPERITHLVTVSCTGFSAPGLDVGLLQELPLKPTVQRTNVGFMGCHGAINGMRVAAHIAEADPGAIVLLCAVELCTLHNHYGDDPEQIVANALFADGAAAVVVAAGDSQTVSNRPCVSQFGSYLFPNTTQAMSWRISDHAFEMTLSTQLPDVLRRELAPWLDAWLALQDRTRKDIGSWAIHPGGPRILAAVAESAQITEQQLVASKTILREFGNMSSPTVLFILQELQRLEATGPTVVLAFGPGVVAEAMLVE